MMQLGCYFLAYCIQNYIQPFINATNSSAQNIKLG